MSSTELVPTPDNDNALQSLLTRIIPYEKAGAVIPQDLLQCGILGSSVVIASGLLAIILPSATAIRRGDFFCVLGSAAAGLDSIMGLIIAPAIIFGGVLLMLDAYLLRVRTSWRWRYVVVVQAVAGGVVGMFCTIFLTLVILNIVIWVVAYALTFIIIGAIIASIASAYIGSD